MRIQLSNNFYLDEFTDSVIAERHGIEVYVAENTIEIERLARLAQTILQPARDVVGRMDITSGYRPLALNRLVGSDDKSQHVQCLAADVRAKKVTPLGLCETIIDLSLPFDQLIYEFGSWCHVSIAEAGKQPRCQVLTSHRFIPQVGKPRVEYLPGLLTINEVRSQLYGAA